MGRTLRTRIDGDGETSERTSRNARLHENARAVKRGSIASEDESRAREVDTRAVLVRAVIRRLPGGDLEPEERFLTHPRDFRSTTERPATGAIRGRGVRETRER